MYIMDFDHDMDIDSPPSFSQSSSAMFEMDTDLVKWQGSQTKCEALDALLVEAARPVVRRSPRNKPKFSTSASTSSSFGSRTGSFGSSSSSSSFSSGTHSNKSVHLKSRPRHSRVRHSITGAAPSSLTTPFDPREFLDLVKGVSEKADENARLKRHLLRTRSHGSTENSDRSGFAKMKGKEKENRRLSNGVSSDPTHPSPMDVDSGSGPLNSDIALTSTPPSPSSDVTHPVRHRSSPPRNEMPPPPVPVPRAPNVSGKRTSSDPSITQAIPLIAIHTPPPPPPVILPTAPCAAVRPQPRTLTQIPPPSPTLKAHDSTPSQPRASRPSLSQSSTRPPELGMRRTLIPSTRSSCRTNTIGTISTFTPSQSLPSKQKGFRPPLASKALPTPPNSNSVSPPKARATEGAEADSSYEDTSFDMDALEETMRKYD